MKSILLILAIMLCCATAFAAPPCPTGTCPLQLQVTADVQPSACTPAVTCGPPPQACAPAKTYTVVRHGTPAAPLRKIVRAILPLYRRR